MQHDFESDLLRTVSRKSTAGKENDAALVDLRSVERRYALENRLIRAVRLGQLHLEEPLLSSASSTRLEKRCADPLRNSKNHCIIMNTLLRKAAEEGGVHPFYLDRASSELAIKIEHLPSPADVGALMRETFRTYCRLVRKHSVQKYSMPVQRAILLVDRDLSADLSPASIAAAIGISAGYLSTVFRRETGKTLTEHIRARRLDHAKALLKTTDLQIQAVALHCGILDVQYFSRLFKRHTGISPTEYRESRRTSSEG